MDTSVAVIGAGPYGLSTAAHLSEAGVETAIFGPTMDTWGRAMPAGMLLKSERFASNLSAPVSGWTLGDYCARESTDYTGRDSHVPLELFVEYGREFQRRFAPDHDPRFVSGLRQIPGGFSVTVHGDTVVTARRVVVAVGITHFAHTPPMFAQLGERVTHASAHRRFADFAGRRVAVIGAGSSAVEVTAGLVDAGADVHMVARRAEIPFWDTPGPHDPAPSRLERLRTPSSGLGPGMKNRLCEELPDVFRHLPPARRLRVVRGHLGPMSPWWLRETVLTGADVRTRTTVSDVRVMGDTVVLKIADANGSTAELSVDHVICATGYIADIDRLGFLDPPIRRALKRVGGMPELSRSFESSVPGLYFLGTAAAGSFGPLLRFVLGSGFAAPRVSSHLVHRGSRPRLHTSALTRA